MGWISSLATERWTAVSAAEEHAIQVRDAVESHRRPGDRIVVGNWVDDRLLQGERYDTVLADYLLGAIEGFAPYFQEGFFARLRPHVGGRLYIVGLEPYVSARPLSEAGNIIWEIGRFRDVCLLLAGEQPYREYPMQWVMANLAASYYRVIATRRFAIRYRQRFVNSQIDMSVMRLPGTGDAALAAALKERGERLRQKALTYIAQHGSIPCGYDYVIAAEPVR